MTMKVLKFETPTCSHCKLITPMLEGRAKNGEFELESINAETNPELASKYQVMSVPTAVIFRDDNEPVIARGVSDIMKQLN